MQILWKSSKHESIRNKEKIFQKWPRTPKKGQTTMNMFSILTRIWHNQFAYYKESICHSETQTWFINSKSLFISQNPWMEPPSCNALYVNNHLSKHISPQIKHYAFQNHNQKYMCDTHNVDVCASNHHRTIEVSSYHFLSTSMF